MSANLDSMSMNLEQEAQERLQSVFPDCFSEGKLDIDKLLSLCGEYISNDFEKYKFEWKGKAECLQLAQKRSTGTLRPCPEESVNWDTTQNLYIEGDNLEVLKLLQTAYFRRVKMIYIDPPYNTGNDFVYEDDFRDPMARYKEVTAQTTKSNPESMGRFHTNWLNMMYPRLRLAANLLRDDGVVFISIDDNEVTNLRRICDEVFGEENFVDTVIWKKRYGGGAKEKYLVSLHEYVLMYCKSILSLDELFIPLTKDNIERYYQKRDQYYDIRGGYRTHPLEATKSMDARENLVYPIPAPDGTMIMPKRQWLWSKERAYTALQNNELEVYKGNEGDWQVATKQYLRDGDGVERGGKLFSIIENIYTQHGTNEMLDIFGDAKAFPFPKPINLVKQFIQVGMGQGDIVLDFFSGSATTAHAVMQLNVEDGGNRQFICVQLPEVCDENSEAYKAGYKNICEIGKERIRRAGAKLLSENQQMQLGQQVHPLDVGFKAFKLDTSNLKLWDSTPVAEDDLVALSGRLHGMIDTVKPDRSDLDMVYEVMLKMGVPLTFSVTPIAINGKMAYSIGEDAMMLICLTEGITAEDVTAMADYAPAKIILAERGLADDTAMSNAHYILRDRGIELKLI